MVKIIFITMILFAGCSGNICQKRGLHHGNPRYIMSFDLGEGNYISDSISYGKKNIERIFNVKYDAIVTFKFTVRSEKSLDVFFSNLNKKNKKHHILINNNDVKIMTLPKGSYLMVIEGNVPCNTIVEWQTHIQHYSENPQNGHTVISAEAPIFSPIEKNRSLFF